MVKPVPPTPRMLKQNLHKGRFLDLHTAVIRQNWSGDRCLRWLKNLCCHESLPYCWWSHKAPFSTPMDHSACEKGLWEWVRHSLVKAAECLRRTPNLWNTLVLWKRNSLFLKIEVPCTYLSINFNNKTIMSSPGGTLLIVNRVHHFKTTFWHKFCILSCII